MAWAGKIIGGGIGWAFGGPLGALLGGVLGNTFDRMVDNQAAPGSRQFHSHQQAQTQPGNFAVALMALCAYVIRADGRVSSAEVQKVREFVARTFSSDDAQDMMIVLKQILHQHFDIASVCTQIAQNMAYEERLQICHLLFSIALADGELSSSETQAIHQIGTLLGISDSDMRSVFGASGSRAHTGARPASSADASGHYQVLGLPATASNEELKSAYRELAKKFHPDRVAHLGEEYREFAEQKFKRLQEAWSAIRSERGL